MSVIIKRTIGLAYFSQVLCVLAGLIYLVRFKRLNRLEKLILWIIWMNVLADGTSLLLSIHMDQTHFIYNILLPIERILTLSIYARHSTRSLEKKLHWIAMGLVIVLYGFGYWYYKFNDLHYASAITTGLILALLSYIHLKAFALDKTKGSVLIAFFALANLVYFTLMVSSISALQVALDISMDFAKTIGMGNLLAYSLWSVILIIGILWKRQET